jgi:hypothetical protein
MRVFISSPNVDQPPASLLIEGLRSARAEVDHSPRGPLDPRWGDWYDVGCQQAIERCDTFVMVVDRVWDSSTWMAHEASVGRNWPPARPLRWRVHWNPERVEIKSEEMAFHLVCELPVNLAHAVALLTCSKCSTFGRDLAAGKEIVKFLPGGWGYQLIIDSHSGLERKSRQANRGEGDMWLLRCRDCGSWWHAEHVPMFDLRRVEPANVSSVEDWLAKTARSRPRISFPRGHYVTYLLCALGVLAGVAVSWLVRLL